MTASKIRRCFILQGGGHNKFWTVEVVDCHYLATFGRIGTQGQTQVKSYANQGLAVAMANKMMKEKLGKGYVETGNSYPGAAPSILLALTGGVAPATADAPLAPVPEDAPRRIRRDL